MESVLKDIEGGKVPHLKHVEVQHDGSKPVIEKETHVKKWDKEGLLKGIEQGVHLKHVEVQHDASKPVIEPTAHIKQNNHAQLMQDVTKAAKARASKDGEEEEAE